MDLDQTEGLERFEAVLAEIQEEYARCETQIEDLKLSGKTRTATFKQLLARRLTLKEFLNIFARHRL